MDSDKSNEKEGLFYPDPMCSALSLLADAVSAPHSEDTTSSVPSLNIKTVKEVAKVDGSDEASNSNKPIKFMASSFAAYSSLKFRLRLNKTITNNDADLPSTSKNPANFMGSAIEEGSTSKADDDNAALLIKEKRRRALNGDDAENDDVIDQDLVAFNHSPNKLVGSSTRKKRQRFNIVVEAAPSELPQEFKDKITELGGNEITLLITKSLYDSDLNGQQNRLSIPSKQIENVNFLREGELVDLEEGKGIEVKLIQPSLEVTNLTLAKWNMRKSNGRVSSSYVLRSSSWKQVVQANELKAGDRVQVWSFRVQEKLCMAIVKV